MPDSVKVPEPVLVRERLPPTSLTNPEMVNAPLATSKVVFVDRTKGPENAPDPAEVPIDPPLRIIGSAPISAWRSNAPPLILIPWLLEPKAELLLTISVPDVSVVKP